MFKLIKTYWIVIVIALIALTMVIVGVRSDQELLYSAWCKEYGNPNELTQKEFLTLNRRGLLKKRIYDDRKKERRIPNRAE